MKVTRKYLHKIEMDMVNLAEEKREEIITYFSALMDNIE